MQLCLFSDISFSYSACYKRICIQLGKGNQGNWRHLTLKLSYLDIMNLWLNKFCHCGNTPKCISDSHLANSQCKHTHWHYNNTLTSLIPALWVSKISFLMTEIYYQPFANWSVLMATYKCMRWSAIKVHCGGFSGKLFSFSGNWE